MILTRENLTEFVKQAADQYHKDSNKITYRMCADFSEELAKVRLDLKSKHLLLPEKPILIELPEGLFKYGEGGSHKHFTRLLVSPVRSFLGILWTAISYEGGLSTRIGTISFEEFDSSLDPEDYLKKCRGDYNTPMVANLYRFVINTLAYLKSGDPDLRVLCEHPPRPGDFKGSYRDWARECRENKTILVGFGYKKAPLRHVGETSVRGHFRWQPFGPEKSKIKLVWIAEHKRTYEKEPGI